jgi:hypothetical protein
METRIGPTPACSLLFLLALSSIPGRAMAQGAVIRPDLAGVANGDGWTLANRAATTRTEDGRVVVSLDGRQGNGAAWLDGVDFRNGTIEVLIRGKNNPGASFVGIAFRGLNDEVYDAVYFRPFNFVADNDLSRGHMVQYISHPVFTWFVLRQTQPGAYEAALANPPDPERFFRARIIISRPEIRVFVGEDPEPCLVVNELSDREGGRIGLWVGNTSDGEFAELILHPEP